jgi:hypothetical protein
VINRFSVVSKTVIRCLLLALLTGKRISCIVISTSNRSKIAPLLFVCVFAEDGSPHDIVCPGTCACYRCTRVATRDFQLFSSLISSQIEIARDGNTFNTLYALHTSGGRGVRNP